MERKTHEQFIEEIAALNPYYSNNEFEIVDKYVNAKTKVRCKCLKCGDFFERRPDHLRRGQGCPKCDNMGTGPTLMTHEAFIKKLLSKNTKYASSEFEIVGKYQGATKEVICHCPLHGNWSTTSSSLLRGAGCPKCANRMTEDVFLEKLLERNEQYSRGEIEITGEYINSKTKIQGRCLVCGHEWEKTPNDLLGNHGCPNYRRHPEWVDPKTPSSEQFLQRLSAMHPNIERGCARDPGEEFSRRIRCRTPKALLSKCWITSTQGILRATRKRVLA